MTELAINGGKPVRNVKKNPWPAWPVFGKEERKNLLAVFDSGQWWYGRKVTEFEEKFAAFQNARYGVTASSGTTALETALLALGIGAGDEVIIPPYTFVATATAVLKVNAIPVFADIDLNTGNLDPAAAEKKITRKTKAIMPVHVGGLPADMDSFKRLAKKYRLKIIEDACHSWGSRWKNKGTGSMGDCGAFSFQMSKNITAGEGGIILTNSRTLAETARSYTNCGRQKNKPWYQHYLPGSNLRLTELQAAILLGQLNRLKQQTLKREANGKFLDETLRDLPGIRIIHRDPRITRRAYHLYIFRFIPNEWPVTREKFIKTLAAEGVPLSTGYSFPLYKNPLFQNKNLRRYYASVRCPNAEQFCREAVWIKHSLLLSGQKDMLDIVRAIEKVWEHRKNL